ncbi:shikimate kinase [Candidatus Laterigemmans baculatus]|uniref:shikimate kinase n=1 Tax=Candidatus Laterigemmans baculatus TaxID=2770505 RepID=UPI00193B7EDC|nr:shikimate kinase [Candidatus Laterigemmans baculatus]
MSHLFLAGYRGTGKSSIAALLAQRWSLPAVDLDAVVQELAGRSIAEIFADAGEAEFRRLESQALGEVAARHSPQIVALGGGAVLREENRRVIRSSGRCVRLTASVETIAARIAGDGVTAAQRPPLTRLGQIEEIRQLLEARREAYEAAAEWTVDTEGKSLAEVAEEIGRWWESS